MDELMLDDIELVEQCIRHDRFAQRILFEKYSGKMLRVCSKYIKNQEDCREVVSNSFLKVFSKIGQLKGNLEPWIRRIVVNSAIDFLRQSKTYKETFLHVGDERFFDTQPDLNESEAEALMHLPPGEFIKFIHQLPPASQLIFNLFVIDEITHKEISQKLNISEGTSKWHVSDARKKLRIMIKERLKQINVHGS